MAEVLNRTTKSGVARIHFDESVSCGTLVEADLHQPKRCPPPVLIRRSLDRAAPNLGCREQSHRVTSTATLRSSPWRPAGFDPSGGPLASRRAGRAQDLSVEEFSSGSYGLSKRPFIAIFTRDQTIQIRPAPAMVRTARNVHRGPGPAFSREGHPRGEAGPEWASALAHPSSPLSHLRTSPRSRFIAGIPEAIGREQGTQP
jgi:hypothetical protein